MGMYAYINDQELKLSGPLAVATLDVLNIKTIKGGVVELTRQNVIDIWTKINHGHAYVMAYRAADLLWGWIHSHNNDDTLIFA
jgi:hypothetical protein